MVGENHGDGCLGIGMDLGVGCFLKKQIATKSFFNLVL